jgi:hypothetical protein
MRTLLPPTLAMKQNRSPTTRPWPAPIARVSLPLLPVTENRLLLRATKPFAAVVRSSVVQSTPAARMPVGVAVWSALRMVASRQSS